MRSVVSKFGGTSLADSEQIRKVRDIVASDRGRRFLVPSAPGKRGPEDTKITDLLYLCRELARQKLDISEPFGRIESRYRRMAEDLKVGIDMDGSLARLRKEIQDGASRDYVGSRGEFICGLVLADLLKATFVDPADVLRFRTDGLLDPISYDLLKQRLKGEGIYVVPGFYGADAEGNVKTFPRGGSDITGAVIARAVGARIYENWTDVSGLLTADPTIVPDARPVREITYREIRELSYMGATVIHDEAMFPVREAQIPIHIRNTNRPNDPGTMILSKRELTDDVTVGIAGRPNFTMLYIEKALMNQERGFGKKILEVVASHDISYDHTPSGIDTMSVVIRDEELDGKGEALLEDIRRAVKPDRTALITGLALIATVGEGMSHRIGVAAKLFNALATSGINVRIIDQGASEMNIIVGVETRDYKPAVRAIHKAFVTG